MAKRARGGSLGVIPTTGGLPAPPQPTMDGSDDTVNYFPTWTGPTDASEVGCTWSLYYDVGSGPTEVASGLMSDIYPPPSQLFSFTVFAPSAWTMVIHGDDVVYSGDSEPSTPLIWSGTHWD